MIASVDYTEDHGHERMNRRGFSASSSDASPSDRVPMSGFCCTFITPSSGYECLFTVATA
jgi:hypothetical protein